MHVTKKYSLALLMGSLLASPSLIASEWSTLAARATAATGYEVRANQFRVAKVPLDYFDGLQAGAKQLTLPLPDGGEVTFTLEAYDLLPADLAAKYPQIRTFRGHNPSRPLDTGRFDLGPQGFHAMFSHQGKMVFVDPLRNAEGYAVYYQQDAHSRLDEEADRVLGAQVSKLARKVQVDGNARKRYTIAISATGEFTQYHGGSQVLAMAAIATLLNRVNQVYQRDVGAEFVLATGNDEVVFTNPATDPFDNNDNDAQTNIGVQALYFTNMKLGNFDIGHVLNTGGGGLAGLAVLCTNQKSSGMSGSATPVGDAFFVDYVAHEIGHQFGADHTFNGTSGSCGGGNRVASQAYEPGSGSSIMAYAGICGEENIQANSDPYFHSKSIEQMRSHMATYPSCGTALTLGHSTPQAVAGRDYVIPANTPFALNGAGSDLDGNALLYNWEQIDLGTESSSAATMIDDGTRPLFRFVAPTPSPERILPSLPSLLSGTLAKGDAWPTTNRDLNFRLTVRDGQGGVASDDMKVQVVKTSSVFRITNPFYGVTLTPGASQVLAWDVAGTDQAPISCSKVDISVTQDEGANWTMLAVGQSNNGAATVTLPANLTSSVRLKVACSDNIFFAISPLKLPLVQSGTNSGGGGGGGGSLGFWTLALALLGWHRRAK
ncbi:reprolysin-like metallopeptidase [Aeromonas sp.]|uniref:reprolysin-like metallopeptidase n=1 Tax=Aeromonas sp. TaxID=647 RepID=UPI0025898D9F|nr:zinc-dependent metalloprotease family protein [Aeromonas sp.]MCX7128218.1 M12 family metallo-peptidase [Aeromonas sp.]